MAAGVSPWDYRSGRTQGRDRTAASVGLLSFRTIQQVSAPFIDCMQPFGPDASSQLEIAMARAQLERYQTFVVILLTLGAAAPAHSGPGDLDVRFGTHGQTEVPGQVDSAALIPLPDGRILVFGIPEDKAARSDGAIAVARLLANGEPDAAFGPGGHIDLRLGSEARPVPTDALLLADGRILVAGYFRGTENEWFEWTH